MKILSLVKNACIIIIRFIARKNLSQTEIQILDDIISDVGKSETADVGKQETASVGKQETAIAETWEHSMTQDGKEALKFHEGLRLTAYTCPTGHLTIGYGHTSDKNLTVTEGMQISLADAERLLDIDIAEAEMTARRLIPNFNDLSPRRRDALINMAFQLGYFNLSKFTSTLNYIRIGQFDQAAEGLKRTLWYKQTQRDRTDWIISALKEG